MHGIRPTLGIDMAVIGVHAVMLGLGHGCGVREPGVAIPGCGVAVSTLGVAASTLGTAVSRLDVAVSGLDLAVSKRTFAPSRRASCDVDLRHLAVRSRRPT